MKRFLKSAHHHAGFTIVELLVSVGIFALMTTLVVVKYGNFSGSVLLTNLAYDVAITIRTAQTYGLSVRNSDKDNITPDFQSGYGVNFSTDAGSSNQIIFFIDNGPGSLKDNGLYDDGSDDLVSKYYLKRGAVISSVCVGSPGCSGTGTLTISFKRPNPNSNICLDTSCGESSAEITIKGTDDSIRRVSVRENGQISVIE